MICDPFIGLSSGAIEWFNPSRTGGEPDFFMDQLWRRYDVFEREKLTELNHHRDEPVCVCMGNWYTYGLVLGGRPVYSAEELIGYQYEDYCKDSESSRLLKRAELLKAVCEKEGIPWLSKEKASQFVENAKWHTSCLETDTVRETTDPEGGSPNFFRAPKKEKCQCIPDQRVWCEKHCQFSGYVPPTKVKIEAEPECEGPGGGCYRSQKVEKRLAEHYYTRHEIDERLEAVLDALEEGIPMGEMSGVVLSSPIMPAQRIEDLRKRFL